MESLLSSQIDPRVAMGRRQMKSEVRNPLPIFAFIAIGSNLGDSRSLVFQAMDRLQKFSRQPLAKSSLLETFPVDCPPGSPNFFNAVVRLIPNSAETPESLLKKLQALEKEFGRTQKKVLNEARPLDLDLIAFGNEIRVTPELTLPHPRAHLRRFVLQPLAEIAPDLILPGQGSAVSELLRQLTTAEIVRKLP
jgi:2-amino-4-hydroxy-6-hydroxymethyldihydropteridine diphosphokinase